MPEMLNIDGLQELHSAGLTHVHLLPSYDYGSVPEKQSDQKIPEASMASLGSVEIIPQYTD